MTSTNSECVCGPCGRDDEKKEANNWCSTCGEGLCNMCSKDHKKNRASSKHGIIPIQQVDELNTLLLSDWNVCKVHASQEVTLFCKQHDEVCCALCISASHRNCHIISVEEASKDVQKNFALSNLQSRIDNIVAFYNAILQRKCNNVKDVVSQLETIETKISFIESEFAKLVKSARVSLKSKADETLSKISTDRDKIAAKRDDLQQKAKDIITLKKHASTQQMFVSLKRLDAQQDILEQDIKNNQEVLRTNSKLHHTIPNSLPSEVKNLFDGLEIRSNMSKDLPELSLAMQAQTTSVRSGNVKLLKSVKLEPKLSDKIFTDLDVWKICCFPHYQIVVLMSTYSDILIILERETESVKIVNLEKGFTPFYIATFDTSNVMVVSITTKRVKKVNVLNYEIQDGFSAGFPICCVGDYLLYCENESVKVYLKSDIDKCLKKIELNVEVGYMCEYGNDKFTYASYYGGIVECMTLTGESVFKLNEAGAMGVAVDKNNYIYVSLFHDRSILRLKPNGKIDRRISEIGYCPLGLAYDGLRHELICHCMKGDVYYYKIE